MPLLYCVKRGIERTDGDRNPIRERAIGVRPEQRRAAIRAELPGDAGRRLIAPQRIYAARDGNG